MAAEIVRHGGAVVCALVSPYRATREEVRALVGDGFVEIYVDTPLEVVQARDVKGLYAGAERGEVKKMTGVSDPYEPPNQPELRLETVNRSAAQNAAEVIAYLEGRGLLEAA